METDVTIRDVMTREYVGVSESDSVLGAAKVMYEEGESVAVVLRGTEPVGVLTEWDVLEVVADEADPETTEVGTVMTGPVIAVGMDERLSDAAGLMAAENIRHLVVVDGPRTGAVNGTATPSPPAEDEELAGLLTERDVIAAAGSIRGVTEGGTGPGTGRGGAPEEPAAETAAVGGAGNPTAEGDSGRYTTQGICESCGALADALQERNGQLVCADCRGV